MILLEYTRQTTLLEVRLIIVHLYGLERGKRGFNDRRYSVRIAPPVMILLFLLFFRSRPPAFSPALVPANTGERTRNIDIARAQ